VGEPAVIAVAVAAGEVAAGVVAGSGGTAVLSLGAAGHALGAGLALALVEGLVELDARALHELLVLVRDGAGERWSGWDI